MSKEWFSTIELVGIGDLPTTPQGVNLKARREQWLKRKRKGIQGKAVEYHIDSLPDKAKSVLKAHDNYAEYYTKPNDPLLIWVQAYQQMTSEEREQVVAVLMRYGIANFLEKVGVK